MSIASTQSSMMIFLSFANGQNLVKTLANDLYWPKPGQTLAKDLYWPASWSKRWPTICIGQQAGQNAGQRSVLASNLVKTLANDLYWPASWSKRWPTICIGQQGWSKRWPKICIGLQGWSKRWPKDKVSLAK